MGTILEFAATSLGPVGPAGLENLDGALSVQLIAFVALVQVNNAPVNVGLVLEHPPP